MRMGNRTHLQVSIGFTFHETPQYIPKLMEDRASLIHYLFLSCPPPCPLFLELPFHAFFTYKTTLTKLSPSTPPNSSKFHSFPAPFSLQAPLMASNNKFISQNFHDFLPIMVEKLGGEGLVGELCNGFNLLMDQDKGAITFDSLKKNASVLGLQNWSDDDLRSMLREGDFDGDGALNQMEFCVLMFRLSPELMEESEDMLEEALEEELKGSS